MLIVPLFQRILVEVLMFQCEDCQSAMLLPEAAMPGPKDPRADLPVFLG
jgi:hypothetical protein